MDELAVIVNWCLLIRYARDKESSVEPARWTWGRDPSRDVVDLTGVHDQIFVFDNLDEISVRIVDIIPMLLKSFFDIGAGKVQWLQRVLFQGEEDSRFFKSFPDGSDIVSEATGVYSHQLAGLRITSMNTDCLKFGRIIGGVDGAARKDPHATGEYSIGMSLHHEELQVRPVIDEHHRGGWPDLNLLWVVIVHASEANIDAISP